MRDEGVAGAVGLALLSRVVKLLPVVFQRHKFITLPRFEKFEENERKVIATRAGDSILVFRRRIGNAYPGYVRFVQLARSEWIIFVSTHFSPRS